MAVHSVYPGIVIYMGHSRGSGGSRCSNTVLPLPITVVGTSILVPSIPVPVYRSYTVVSRRQDSMDSTTLYMEYGLWYIVYAEYTILYYPLIPLPYCSLPAAPILIRHPAFQPHSFGPHCNLDHRVRPAVSRIGEGRRSRTELRSTVPICNCMFSVRRILFPLNLIIGT
jgi:hypothetical protein